MDELKYEPWVRIGVEISEIIDTKLFFLELSEKPYLVHRQNKNIRTQSMTGQEKTENALRYSSSTYEELVSNIPSGVCPFRMKALGGWSLVFVKSVFCGLPAQIVTPRLDVA